MGDAELGQQRHAALNLALRKEAEDANHRRSSVVKLRDEPLVLLCLGFVLGEPKRVVQVNDGVPDVVLQKLEGGVGSGLPATHVVALGSSTALVPNLQEGNQDEDLPLSAGRKVVPLLSRGVGGNVLAVVSELPREVDSLGLDNVAHKGSHGHSGMLDLRMADKTNGGLLSLTPEVSSRQIEGVVEFHNWVASCGGGWGGVGSCGLRVSGWVRE